MNAQVPRAAGLNFDPDDPSLLGEHLPFPVWLQGTTTPARTPYPNTDHPVTPPPQTQTPGPKYEDLRHGTSYRVGRDSPRKHRVAGLDIDLECVDPPRDRVVT